MDSCNEIFPVKKISKHNNQSKLSNGFSKKLIQDKHRLWYNICLLKSSNNMPDRESLLNFITPQYKSACERVSMTVAKLKMTYELNLITRFKSQPKLLLSYINQRKKGFSSINYLIDANGNHVSEPIFHASMLN